MMKICGLLAALALLVATPARADEIKEELDGLLSRVDQLPNFQDIQEEQRMLTQDDRWKIFYFSVFGTPSATGAWGEPC